MKIIFMGSPNEVISILNYLNNNQKELGCELVGVVTQPAKVSGRGRKREDPPVAIYAKENELLTFQPERSKDEEFITTLKNLSPDVIITAAYGQILSQDFLNIPSRAVINIHPSKLPKYRGATPVQAALLNGDKKTAVSILYTVKALDAGNIIVQKDFDINAQETADELLDRLFKESCVLLKEALSLLQDSDFEGTPQDKLGEPSYCTKIDKTDGLIDWSQSAELIVNKFRAFHPWPGSYSYLENRRINILNMVISSSDFTASPGTVIFNKANKSFDVACGDQWISISSLQAEGAKALDSTAFWNGIRKKDNLMFGGQN